MRPWGAGATGLQRTCGDTGHRSDLSKKNCFFQKNRFHQNLPDQAPTRSACLGEFLRKRFFRDFGPKNCSQFFFKKKIGKFLEIFFFRKNFGILFFGKFWKKSETFLCPENFWKFFSSGKFFEIFFQKNISPTGNRTRVWWVRATYPDQLD